MNILIRILRQGWGMPWLYLKPMAEGPPESGSRKVQIQPKQELLSLDENGQGRLQVLHEKEPQADTVFTVWSFTIDV